MQDIISPDKQWLELRLPATAVDEGEFTQLCEGMDATGQALQTDAKSGEGEHVAWFAPGADEQRTRAQITAAALLLGASVTDVSVRLLNDDWETAWQRDWHGMPIGDSLWVHPSFCDAAPAGRIDIVLDPGMAFGTGQHVTTRLCLEAIERVCRECPPATMLDMGAGSGLLAIAAGKLGAQGIVAIDNDPLAVAASRINAGINGVELESLLGDTPPAPRFFDLVAANILAGPLIDMAPALAGCTGKRLVLSGLLREQMGAVTQACVDAGLKPVRTDVIDGWASIEFVP